MESTGNAIATNAISHEDAKRLAEYQKKLVIKRYPNRKLYDTETSDYVNFSDLYQEVKNGRELFIWDNTKRLDITQPILASMLTCFRRLELKLKTVEELQAELMSVVRKADAFLTLNGYQGRISQSKALDQ